MLRDTFTTEVLHSIIVFIIIHREPLINACRPYTSGVRVSMAACKLYMLGSDIQIGLYRKAESKKSYGRSKAAMDLAKRLACLCNRQSCEGIWGWVESLHNSYLPVDGCSDAWTYKKSNPWNRHRKTLEKQFVTRECIFPRGGLDPLVLDGARSAAQTVFSRSQTDSSRSRPSIENIRSSFTIWGVLDGEA